MSLLLRPRANFSRSTVSVRRRCVVGSGPSPPSGSGRPGLRVRDVLGSFAYRSDIDVGDRKGGDLFLCRLRHSGQRSDRDWPRSSWREA